MLFFGRPNRQAAGSGVTHRNHPLHFGGIGNRPIERVELRQLTAGHHVEDKALLAVLREIVGVEPLDRLGDLLLIVLRRDHQQRPLLGVERHIPPRNQCPKGRKLGGTEFLPLLLEAVEGELRFFFLGERFPELIDGFFDPLLVFRQGEDDQLAGDRVESDRRRRSDLLESLDNRLAELQLAGQVERRGDRLPKAVRVGRQLLLRRGGQVREVVHREGHLARRVAAGLQTVDDSGDDGLLAGERQETDRPRGGIDQRLGGRQKVLDLLFHHGGLDVRQGVIRPQRRARRLRRHGNRQHRRENLAQGVDRIGHRQIAGRRTDLGRAVRPEKLLGDRQSAAGGAAA